ncbi:MAG: hypothetical protein A2Y12_09130 [Planctomycetes bacterium GWF2_42_9]|nr:MAG: hypothetical protein A2Y12_09130 [Planctomycetes bacterium GWF2_42_9]
MIFGEMVMKKNKGFTLVELLVVISIIATLLAVLMPSLNKARLIAQRVVCMNSARQQFLSQLTYTQSNNGKFATFWSLSPWTVRDEKQIISNGQQMCLAYDLYKPYMKDSGIFICASIRHLAKEAPKDWGMCAETKWYDVGYSQGLDKGGWDGVRPNTNPKQLPNYICIPYNWYAGFVPVASSTTNATPYSDLKFVSSTPAWPKQAADCTSAKAVISHVFMTEKGYSKFRDMGHGGSSQWLNITARENESLFAKNTKIKSLDNPVVYGDGHTKYIMKNDMRLRATANGGNLQIAW